MKFFRVFPVLCLMFAVGAVAHAQELQSHFLPERSYNVTIKQTLSGFDGFQDVVPVTNVQRVRIETDARDGDAIPVRATFFMTHQSGGEDVELEQWKFAFMAHDDGTISDVQTLSALEELDPAVAAKILGRQLGRILFRPAYALEGLEKAEVTITSQTPREGADNFIDLTYTMRRDAVNERLRSAEAPMKTEDTGTAVFNTDDAMFLDRSHKEVSRIHVDMDDYGEAKDVVMNKDLTITISVSPRQ
ncbi:hypothetical protein KQI65_17840 [bacterium]|nr:hypothetical protein [bacterium]